jgi:hypothetical protein
MLQSRSAWTPDDRLGLAHNPGEPEVLTRDDSYESLSGERASGCLAQQIPRTAGLLIFKVLSGGNKREQLAIQFAQEHTG